MVIVIRVSRENLILFTLWLCPRAPEPSDACDDNHGSADPGNVESTAEETHILDKVRGVVCIRFAACMGRLSRFVLRVDANAVVDVAGTALKRIILVWIFISIFPEQIS